jgi:hypothetical protein
LDVEVGVVGVGLAGEHAAEFEFGKLGFESIDILGNLRQGIGIVLFRGHRHQLTGVGDALLQDIDGVHHIGQRGALAAQRLGALGIVPDLGVGQFQFDLGQPFLFFRVVKDTP